MSELIARLYARRRQVVAAMASEVAEPDSIGAPTDDYVRMLADVQTAIAAVETVEAEQ